MSLFRDTIQKEVDSVFLNAGEFARSILLDGMPVKAVIDDSAQAFDTRAADNLADQAGLGLLESVRAVYLQDGQLPYQLHPEQQVTMTEMDILGDPFGAVEHWQIIDVQHQDGVTVLKMTRVYT